MGIDVRLIIEIVLAVWALAGLVIRLTPTKKDDEIYQKSTTIFDKIMYIFDKIFTASKKK